MENSSLSPVSITQKVIALHTTRKNLYHEWLSEHNEKSFSQKLEKVMEQSNRFTDQLMNELSNYGDAVSSQVIRDDEYEDMADKMHQSINNKNTSESQADFGKLQQKLVAIYKDILENKNDLPESLQRILESQLSELESSKTE